MTRYDRRDRRRDRRALEHIVDGGQGDERVSTGVRIGGYLLDAGQDGVRKVGAVEEHCRHEA